MVTKSDTNSLWKISFSPFPLVSAPAFWIIKKAPCIAARCLKERNARFELVTCGLGSRRSTN